MADSRSSIIPEDEKRNVRAVLLSRIGGVLLSDFSKDYKKLLLSSLNIGKYGYFSTTDFVKAMPDVVRLEFCEKKMAYKMFGVGDPNSFMSSWAQKAQGNAPPHSNSGRNKTDGEMTLDTDDAKKLMPNQRGLYTLCFPRKYMKYATEKDVEEKFCSYRSLKEINIIPSYIFVRFAEKREALHVLEAYATELVMRIAKEKNAGQCKGKNNDDRKRSSGSDNKSVKYDKGCRSEFEAVSSIMSDNQMLAYKKIEQPSAETGRGYAGSLRSFDGIETASNTSAGSSKNFNDIETASNASAGSSRRFDGIETASNAAAGSSRSFDKIGIAVAGGSNRVHFLSPQKMDQQNDRVVSYELLKISEIQQSQFDDMPALEPAFLNEIPEPESDTSDVYVEDFLHNSADGMFAVHGIPDFENDGSIAVFVGNFPYDSTEESLCNLFLRYDCSHVRMINCFDTRRSTFAFLKLGSLELAERAVVDMNQTIYNDQCLFVGMANSETTQQKVTSGELENITCTLNVSHNQNTQRCVTIKTGSHPPSLSKSHTKPYQLEQFGGMLHMYMAIYKKLGGLTSSLVIRPKTPVDLLVTYVHDNTCFWAQDLSASADMDLLAQVYDIIKDPYNRKGPSRGMGRCMAQFQGEWYRAWIVNTTGQIFEVFFIDFGNRCFLTKVFTSQTDSCVWEIPPIARPFMLSSDCEPGDLKDLEMKVVSAEVVHPGRSDNNYVTEVKIAF